MKKEKFFFNTHTLQYEQLVEPLKAKLIKAFSFLSAVVVATLGLISVAYTYFPSPREKTLLREINQLETRYSIVNEQVDKMSKVLQNVQDRDAGVHRVVFGMDPIDQDVWNGGVGGHQSLSDVLGFGKNGDAVAMTQERLDRLARQLALQSQSLDTIQNLARSRENMLASIPSIKPVREDKLRKMMNLLSGFGVRVHPIHKVRKMHTGMDFTAPKGTAIQSTGEGVVAKVEHNRSGYGNNVLIDHGFGYSTLYAHMESISVNEGQRLKKGQKIGTIGSTGSSTGPHCHYEVHFKGKPVNPVNYCMDGLSTEEYQQLVNAAAAANQSFD